MDLSTTYLGFSLPSPLMPGASPLVDDLDTVKRLEDAGASAIVMHSLFEEQITREQLASVRNILVHENSFAEALRTSQGRRARLGLTATWSRSADQGHGRVPAIGSPNGTTPEGWLAYAKQIQEAGADAVEINFITSPPTRRRPAPTSSGG
jgi:dihydroorotate dehydrogenase (fumarate)